MGFLEHLDRVLCLLNELQHMFFEENKVPNRGSEPCICSQIRFCNTDACSFPAPLHFVGMSEHLFVSQGSQKV